MRGDQQDTPLALGIVVAATTLSPKDCGVVGGLALLERRTCTSTSCAAPNASPAAMECMCHDGPRPPKPSMPYACMRLLLVVSLCQRAVAGLEHCHNINVWPSGFCVSIVGLITGFLITGVPEALGGSYSGTSRHGTSNVRYVFPHGVSPMACDV